jgi:ribonuclease BN (tRNA processing enzyme)
MNIIFLGTNGWYDTDTGNTICVLINSKEYQILLDAGNGIYKADRFINNDKPVYLLLSHFHLDHIEGMHVLNKFNFSQGLRIYGQKNTRQILDTIINEPFTIPLSNLPFSVKVHELSEGMHEIPFPLECYYLKHASPCLGYRFELDGTRIAYVPDTGICENAIRLAEDADLLIAECAYLPGEQNPKWPHLNPQDAVQIARKANAKRLVLVHFDSERYKTLQDRQDAANSILDFDNLTAAYDDLILEI